MLHTILISMMKFCFSPNLPAWDRSPVDIHCMHGLGNLVAIFVVKYQPDCLSTAMSVILRTICCYYYHCCVGMMHVCGYSHTGQRSTWWR